MWTWQKTADRSCIWMFGCRSKSCGSRHCLRPIGCTPAVCDTMSVTQRGHYGIRLVACVANYSRKQFARTFARTIRANVRVVLLAWVFTLTRMRIFAQIVRANCSREQFTLSNAIRANNLRIKLIFDEYFTYWFRQAGSCIWNQYNTLTWTMYFAGLSQFRYAYLHKSMLASQQFFWSLGDTFISVFV